MFPRPWSRAWAQLCARRKTYEQTCGAQKHPSSSHNTRYTGLTVNISTKRQQFGWHAEWKDTARALRAVATRVSCVRAIPCALVQYARLGGMLCESNLRFACACVPRTRVHTVYMLDAHTRILQLLCVGGPSVDGVRVVVFGRAVLGCAPNRPHIWRL